MATTSFCVAGAPLRPLANRKAIGSTLFRFWWESNPFTYTSECS
jgi:hypothetical protein